MRIVLLASGMSYGKSHLVILKGLFHIAFRFETSCLVLETSLKLVLWPSAVNLVCNGWIQLIWRHCQQNETLHQLVTRMGEKCREDDTVVPVQDFCWLIP